MKIRLFPKSRVTVRGEIVRADGSPGGTIHGVSDHGRWATLMMRLGLMKNDERGFASIFTSVGEAWAVDVLDTGTQYIGWGTGVTTAAKGDTTLTTEASEARVSGTRSQSAADTLQWLATMTADGAKAIVEVGVFDASTGGNLVIHANHTLATMDVSGDLVNYTITLELT